MEVPPGGFALTFDKDRSFTYTVPETGVDIQRVGVVAMSITCTEEGLKVHECNIYHLMKAKNNSISAVDYYAYTNALEKMFDRRVNGILDYMRQNMSHMMPLTSSQRGTPAARVTGDSQSVMIEEVHEDEEREAAAWSMSFPRSQAERDAERMGSMPPTVAWETDL